ncbi:hypothetical protein FHG87_019470 [Trinorchestia longiramus]|nr:hypothetical protein FHG87_019470 [Trinorchestia longiramus]
MGQLNINAVFAAFIAFVANVLIGRTDFPTDIVSDDVTVDFIIGELTTNCVGCGEGVGGLSDVQASQPIMAQKWP